jgi:cytochrome c-type biogenesis protein CcmH
MRLLVVMGMVLVWGTVALTVSPAPAFAIGAEETLPDPSLEARAVALHKLLRCLVCQNQSIHDSNANLARDLRRIVRERLAAGENDEQVIDFIVSRYGDWVLLKPPFKGTTLVLWVGPAVLLVLAAAGVIGYFRRRRYAAPDAPLTAEEQRRLEALLEDEG